MSKSRSRRPSRRVEPAEPPPPRHRRIIGLDLGSRRIGVAISDAEGGFIAHRQVIERQNLMRDRAAVAAIVEDYPNATILVGLPLSMDGTEGPQAARARQWARQLLEIRWDAVVFRDERLTTAAARARVGDGAVDAVDAVAAEVLVQDFLNDRSAW